LEGYTHITSIFVAKELENKKLSVKQAASRDNTLLQIAS
jgi:hypothetical protein